MTELAVIANETHQKAVAYFKVAEQYLYKFLMEVKEIRDKQYYKALGFSSFDDYCEKAWNTGRRYMDERIQIAVAFGNEWDFESTYSQLGHSKSLFLARLEPERRQELLTQPQQLPNGETKTIDEMSVRQLKELEKKRDEAERRAQEAESKARHYETLWNQAKNQPPKVVEKAVPDPTDKAKISSLENQIAMLSKRLEMAEKNAELNEKAAKEYEELKQKIEFLHREKDDLHRQIESATALSGLAVKIDNFLKTELAPIRYSRALERLDSEVAARNLDEILTSVEQWCEEMRRYLPKSRRKVVIDFEPAG